MNSLLGDSRAVLSKDNLELSEVLYPSSEISDPESLKSTGFLFVLKEDGVEDATTFPSKERSRLFEIKSDNSI
jgi:hypothetical protein